MPCYALVLDPPPFFFFFLLFFLFYYSYSYSIFSSLFFSNFCLSSHFLQPANVLLDSSFRVRLCDYGLAVGADSDARLQFVGGTEQFMAPEVGKLSLFFLLVTCARSILLRLLLQRMQTI